MHSCFLRLHFARALYKIWMSNEGDVTSHYRNDFLKKRLLSDIPGPPLERSAALPGAPQAAAPRRSLLQLLLMVNISQPGALCGTAC